MKEDKIWICEKCNKHGHLLLENLLPGAEFASKQHALHILREGVSKRAITPVDFARLTLEVNTSPIPNTWQEVSISFLWAVDVWNFMRSKQWENLPDVHDFLQLPVNPAQIPPDFLERVGKVLGAPSN